MASRAQGSTSPTPFQVMIDVGGHRLVADEPHALGGTDAGPSPFGLVLAGLVACTGTTLRMYAEHKGWAPVEIRVELALDLRGERPLIDRKVVVVGALDEPALSRLRDIVERTPVTLALKSGFDIATELGATA
ncbi:OsmC family protein [Caulobacter sp. 602-1]|uniref:OsmC family protein n=1 Tax=unclassified Caulobacter TaxID=2648921 RepID=UPI000F63CD92|nr:OsmC family protein [Caulobacter sp. 602-1]RRN65962.1 OsmC family peroxiredoxin [Caulobacter sp. 602-1]